MIREPGAVAFLGGTRMSARSRHFAIIAPPTPGHFNPLQELGHELVGLGHRVTFVHQPDAASLVGRARIGFEPLSTAIDDEQSLAAYYRALAAPTGPVGLTRMIRATASGFCNMPPPRLRKLERTR